MAQHRRTSTSGVDLHLQEKGHSFKDSDVHILDREDRWFERGVKEATYVHLNRGGCLRHRL